MSCAYRKYISGEYDRYVAANKRKVMKRAGVTTGIGLSVITLITGLSLGLKSPGKDLESLAKREET